jgi:protein TonB
LQTQPASEAAAASSDAKKAAAKPVKAPVVNTKKTTEAAATTAVPVPPPAPKPKAKSVDRQKPVPQTAPVQLDTDESVAGVETLPSAPPPTPVETIAPGTLVAIDETDAWPVSLKRTLPTYPMAARQLGLAGTVVMNVLVNERGTVDQVVLVSGIAGGDLNESAMRAVKNWTYRPATKQGVPVKVWTSEQISFKR